MRNTSSVSGENINELYPQKELTNEIIEQVLGNNYKISNGIIKKGGKIISDKYNILSYIKIENSYILIGKKGSASCILKLDNYGYIQKNSEEFHEIYYDRSINEWVIRTGAAHKIIDINTGDCKHKGSFQFIKNEGGKIIGHKGSQSKVIRLYSQSLFDNGNINKYTTQEEIDKVDILYERFGTKNEHDIAKLIIQDLRDNFEKIEKIQMINLLYIILADELLKKEINHLIGSKFDINSEEGRNQIVNILSKTNYNIITSEELSKIKDNYEAFAFVKNYILNKNSVGNVISRTKNSIGTVISKNFINLSAENIKLILSMKQLQNLKIEDKMSLLNSIENLIKRIDFKKLIDNQNEFGYNISDRKSSEKKDLRTKNKIVTSAIRNMKTAYEKDEDIIIPELVSDIENQIKIEIQKREIEEFRERSNSTSSSARGRSGKSGSNGGSSRKSSTSRGDSDIGITTAIMTGSATAGFIADTIFGDD